MFQEIVYPKTFAELKKITERVDFHDITHELGRDEASIYYYQIYRDTIPKNIQQTLLNKAIEYSKKGKFSLVTNHFPYTKLLQYLPAVKHYVLWSEPEVTDLEAEKFLKDELKDLDYFFYENAPQNRTVPSIKHWQVYVNYSNYTSLK